MKCSRVVASIGIAVFAVTSLVSPIVALAAAKTKATSSGTSASTNTTPSITSSASTDSATVQGYASSAVLQDGVIVQLTSIGANSVEAASQAHVSSMFGLTVDPNQLSYTVANTNLENEVYVATSGTYNVLVSTQAGPIAEGDYVTISAINGVAMDAGTTNTTVFGRAVASFNGKSDAVGTDTLKDNNGNVYKTVTLGIIPVAILIEQNPDHISTKANLPKELQRLGQAIAEKPIGPFRIYLSIGITGISIVIAIVTLYSGVRSSLVAIGRNPLSKKSIFRGLLVIIFTSFIILIIGLFAVYLLLKL